MLFGSDWDIWNNKTDCQQYNTHDMFCLQNFPPYVLQWMMQLKFWSLRHGDWVLSFSFSLAATQFLCPIMAGTKLIASEISFPQSISILSVYASYSEDTLTPLCLPQTLFQYCYFLLKTKDYVITPKETKKKVALNTVPISWIKNQNDWQNCVYITAKILDIKFVLLINIFRKK